MWSRVLVQSWSRIENDQNCWELLYEIVFLTLSIRKACKLDKATEAKCQGNEESVFLSGRSLGCYGGFSPTPFHLISLSGYMIVILSDVLNQAWAWVRLWCNAFLAIHSSDAYNDALTSVRCEKKILCFWHYQADFRSKKSCAAECCCMESIVLALLFGGGGGGGLNVGIMTEAKGLRKFQDILCIWWILLVLEDLFAQVFLPRCSTYISRKYIFLSNSLKQGLSLSEYRTLGFFSGMRISLVCSLHFFSAVNICGLVVQTAICPSWI